MTATATVPPAPPRPRLSVGGRILGTLAVVAGITVLWLVLFSAFGTTHGPVASSTDSAEDHFSGSVADGGLGAVPSGPTWQLAVGQWDIRGGRAAVTATGPTGGAVAVVDPGGTNVQASAQVAVPASGWGLAFRYRDTGDQWFVATQRAGGPLALFVVAGGKLAEVAQAGGAAPTAGSTVWVRSDGDQITVQVDGTTVLRRRDARLADATGVGMELLGHDTTARWDDFRFEVDSAPVVTVPSDAGAGS